MSYSSSRENSLVSRVPESGSMVMKVRKDEKSHSGDREDMLIMENGIKVIHTNEVTKNNIVVLNVGVITGVNDMQNSKTATSNFSEDKRTYEVVAKKRVTHFRPKLKKDTTKIICRSHVP